MSAAALPWRASRLAALLRALAAWLERPPCAADADARIDETRHRVISRYY